MQQELRYFHEASLASMSFSVLSYIYYLYNSFMCQVAKNKLDLCSITRIVTFLFMT